jgi:hypothetical protein
LAGAVLVYVVARVARGHVMRPIRIFCALAIGGAAAAVFALAGGVVPRAFLAMAACVALAFSVNKRLTRPRRWPRLGRTVWLVAAALMLAAIPTDVPREGGSFAFSISEIELALIAVVAMALIAALVTVARGIRADRGDRLLVGVLAGLVVFVVLFPHVPPPAPVWIYPFAILAGGALARANGNLKRP